MKARPGCPETTVPMTELLHELILRSAGRAGATAALKLKNETLRYEEQAARVERNAHGLVDFTRPLNGSFGSSADPRIFNTGSRLVRRAMQLGLLPVTLLLLVTLPLGLFVGSIYRPFATVARRATAGDKGTYGPEF